MTDSVQIGAELEQERNKAISLFEEAIGVSGIDHHLETVGNEVFLKFRVGRRAPIFDHALRWTNRQLPEDARLKGLIGLEYVKPGRFPESVEADVLLSTLTRSTRQVVHNRPMAALAVSYVPFQNNEDNKVIQPASHLIVGRRGVGKSTLIQRAVALLESTPHVPVVLDMQAYAEATADTIFSDVLADMTRRIAESVSLKAAQRSMKVDVTGLQTVSHRVLAGDVIRARAGAVIRRELEQMTKSLGGDIYVFLDDYHVIEQSLQPQLLHVVHGALKGAGGWLKVSGLKSLLNVYDPTSRKGLQVPGDAQLISLDLTLVDPESAESHLRAILLKFLEIVGVGSVEAVAADPVFRRLVWANAGVPRDCLQMFARALEHARRSGRPKVTLTDTNLAIGEFGQQKMDDLEQDARNARKLLRRVVDYLEEYCLEKKKVNAFLVRSEQSNERQVIQVLSDLRIVHLIHPTITPHRAGQRYEAFLLDYSLFTGFRRRPNIKEMLPEDGCQFKATELRTIPALPKGFLENIEQAVE